MTTSKIIFFGTTALAARVLNDLLKQSDIQVMAVVTKPDKQKGRSLQMLPPPVKEAALLHNLPIHQPLKASTPEFADLLKSYQADIFVVFAYGEILKKNIIEIPRLGCLNVHPSLLPKYRGADPIRRALMAGDAETGVCIMDMVLEMDAGDVYAMTKIPIPSNMTLGELEDQIAPLASTSLLQVIRDLMAGEAHKTPQDPSQVTFAPKITLEEEKILFHRSALELHNQIRALSPAPGAWALVDTGKEQKRLKILRAEVTPLQGSPGSNLAFSKKEWIVACGTEALRLLEIQIEGKKAMKIEEFLRGAQHPFTFLNLSY
ncbi:MAG: methionyl-tRNA formyltransferase [Verrucomicrobia bacterium]|nr:methionyl-tRNA formyltransferase [Verrucomicrobiota bacterium]